MPRKSGVITDPLHSDMIEQGIEVGSEEWKKRTAMRKIWTQNQGAYLHHLELAQKNVFGPRNEENLCERFTRAFLRKQKPEMQISPELIESCKSYGLYLQELAKQCQVYSTRMNDIENLAVHRESEETRNALFDLFGKEKLKLKRGTSTRPSGASPPSGKLARSSGASDPSVHMGYPDLKEQVHHVLSDFVADGHFKAEEPLQKFRDHICSDQLLVLSFLKYSHDQRLTMIAEFLKKNK